METSSKNYVKITAIKSGPLMVEGLAEIFNSEGEPLKESDKIYLCRCGQSGHKPFCDGTHKNSEFDLN